MSNTPNLSSIFAGAVATGDLTKAAASVLSLPDYGAQIQAGLGVAIDDVESSDVFLVAQLIDDTGSIDVIPNGAKSVREGHNAVLDALNDSKQGSGILATCHYLWAKKVLYPWTPLAQATRMDGRNYHANGISTPLYDGSIVVLGSAIAKVQEFADAGVPARSATLIVTDGANNDSRATAAQVKRVVQDMYQQERHIVAAMGIDDGSTNFRRVFGEMGIRDEWILTPGNTPSDIRRAFAVFSKSAVRASQSAGKFSQTAAGGFGAP